MIDTGRIDPSQPIDLAAICNTKAFPIEPANRHFGVNLTDEGADRFEARVNIEVQYASEQAIAAVERNGGNITTAYFDLNSVIALSNPLLWFSQGKAVPRRLHPPAGKFLTILFSTQRFPNFAFFRCPQILHKC